MERHEDTTRIGALRRFAKERIDILRQEESLCAKSGDEAGRTIAYERSCEALLLLDKLDSLESHQQRKD